MKSTATVEPASGRLLARNAIWNIVGQIAPMLVAVFAIPRLIHSLGTARFGVLTIAWMVVGYFSLFDFGLGRALTKLVADKLGSNKESELPQLVWTSIGAIFFLGLIGTAVLICGAHLLVYSILKIPDAMRPETLHSFYVLAFAIPIVTTATGLRGVLEAHQEFKLLTAIRIPLGMFTFGGPLLVLLFSQSMVAIVGALLAVRLCTAIAHMAACLVKMPELRHGARFEPACLRAVFQLGGWMTVSNLISPLLVFMDRFLIGAVLSVSGVAYYATPFEMISKLLVVPLAVVGPLFPAFAMNSVRQDHARTSFMLRRAVKYIFVFVFPVAVLAVSFAHQALKLWLGEAFAQNSAPVLQWLAVGVLVNCLSVVAAALVQGYGRPDLAAKFHMVELPLYAIGLWSMLKWHGVEGAAIAWTLRVSLDALLLFAAAGWLARTPFLHWRQTIPLVAGVGVILAICAVPLSLSFKIPFVAITLLIFAAGVWLRLSKQERSLIVRLGRGPGNFTEQSALSGVANS